MAFHYPAELSIQDISSLFQQLLEIKNKQSWAERLGEEFDNIY